MEFTPETLQFFVFRYKKDAPVHLIEDDVVGTDTAYN